MATAIATANEFIRLAKEDGAPVDQLKLQKLLFYAQAWFLAMRDRALFDSAIKAWPWGPVVPEVYSETRSYGRAPITEMLREVRKVGPEVFDYQYVIPDGMGDPEGQAFVKSLWDGYKHYTGVQLSNATHAPGEPWTVVRERIGNLDQKPVIPDELIKDVFKRKLVDA